MGMIGGFIAGATGVSFLRSATRNATEFDTALYDINRQLGDDENIKDYIKFIDKYALKTGRARVEIAQQTAELLKTRKVGEGLDMIGDKIEIMTYATNQLELDTLTAAQTAEILGDAYKMTGNELKGAFAQANMMEDIYGSLVAGSDIAKIISRNIPLLSNAKIVPKEQALSLSTFAKANTSLEGISVGTALDRIMRGGDKAYGGGFTKRAESTGKTALDIIMQDAEKYNELQTQAKKNEFVLSRLDRANAEDIQVLNSIFKETSSINSARLQSFLKVQKQYEQGTINSIEYRKELEKLNKAERTIAASLLSSEKALKDFNRTIQLIGDRHDATLGRISESWKMVSGAFGNQVLFPALNLLADGLERIAPTVTMLINDYPTLMKVLAGAGAVAGIVAIVNSFTMLRNALLGVALGLNTIAKSKAFWLLTAAGVAYDVISSKYNKFQESLTPEQRSKWSENEKMMKEQGLNPKQMNEKREALKKEFNGQEASRQTVFAPPMSGTQSRPTQGSIDIRLMTDDKTQAIVDVKKEDGTFLNILQPTKTRN
jgi:hypothetical protein